MIILAHDGSIYGDWVARYALQFAASEADRKLLLLHILDGNIKPDIVEARFARFTKDCQEAGVECAPHLLPLGKTVHRSLHQAIPRDPEALLVCGTRVKPNKRSFLSGSVAEKLLRSHQCPVLALRVVQPGLLGNPHDLLIPLAGHLRGFARVWPVFRRLALHLNTVYLFRALAINPLLQTHLTPTRKQVLHNIGRAHLAQICAELKELMPLQPFRLDQRISFTTDWAYEILTLSSRLKVQMILLGVSERSLAHRIFHGVGIEKVLRETPCDIGIYRGP
jgi:nucleotide-binding universal stress UspA family protein